MTTAADIINDAALAAGVGDAYNPLDATAAGIALRTFNRMLDSWSNESLAVFNVTEGVFPMTAGVGQYSSALLPSRPINVQYAFVRQNNVDYTLQLIGAEDYARIAYKITSGLPAVLFVNSGMPTSMLNYFPVPSTPYEAHVGYLTQLATVSNLQTPLSLPPGYERALVYGLASMLAPMFGTEPSPTCIYHAKAAKEAIRTTNYPLDESQLGLPITKGLFNIYRGS